MKAIAGRRDEWIASVNDGDLERYAALVTQDVVWLPPSGDPIVGREGFKAWLEPFFGRYAYDFSLDHVRVRPCGSWCAELGEFRSVLSLSGEGEGQEHAGRYFALWRLEQDGEWRIERYVDISGLT